MASSEEMPKNAASNLSMAFRNPPRPFISLGRPIGTSVIVSTPSRITSQNSLGLFALGKRHPIPIIAIVGINFKH
ncbi:hypothetical protein NWP26_05150 [Chrysosporum ovalisporum APH033B]|nr:hypothetical protein [Umezakia ovalisporum]MDH6066659.1 hypothetical protein [Umezakia ovalisporum APH033B]MDH6071589.1 hypothetical protein [Umezakia ovalisporum CobakiLakeA]MDH6073049.1 hypothetical protein [Umezakia ovalisporum CS-1034]MDH6080929.1 hypothetical protein [Umezakia ovalisporum FSS-44]MDH6096508.1 hypothetical protein [Umezakia ovalisporum CobakiLakeB]